MYEINTYDRTDFYGRQGNHQGAFCSVFTREPWNDDWSNEHQLDICIIDLIGCHNPLTYGMYEDWQHVGLSMGIINHWYTDKEYYIDKLCIMTEQRD